MADRSRRGNGGRGFLSILAALFLALAAHPASAKLAVKVEYGWGESYRAGRWTPIFITTSDPELELARNIIIQVAGPHDQSHGIRILTGSAIRPQESTVAVYVPLTYQLDQTVVTIRDMESGRKLYEDSLDPDDSRQQRMYGEVQQGDLFLGISGRGRALGDIDGSFQWHKPTNPEAVEAAGTRKTRRPNTATAPATAPATGPAPALPGTPTGGYSSFNTRLRVGYVPASRVPDTLVGFDGMDALILNAPILGGGRPGALAPKQQQAIADWVRGGGKLLLWPGTELIPQDSTLAQLLPASIGDATTVPLTLAETEKFGLLSKVEKVAARQLAGSQHSRRYAILDGKGEIYFGAAGLGAVAVMSIDAAQLSFKDDNSAREFWRPILQELLRAQVDAFGDGGGHHYGGTPADQTRVSAMNAVANRLGDVPGVGAFDFTYVAVVLIAMMLVVGPIDWFILRRLGKQPWTWVTISGWIALVTVGAIYIGAILRSGDLHYRTVRLVDQVEDQVVGVVDVGGIYSPKTQAYALDGPADAWWRPAHLDFFTPWRRNRTPSEVIFEQDRNGTRPLTRLDRKGNRIPTMMVNVWNLRFVQSELGDPSAQKPLIAADLRRETGRDGSLRIVGTITNLTDRELKNIRIVVKDGAARPFAVDADGKETETPADAIAARQKMAFRARIVTPTQQQVTPQENMRMYGPYGANPRQYDAVPELAFMAAACDLAPERAARTRELIQARPDLATIVAESEGVTPEVKLQHEGEMTAIEKHWRVIRALVKLQ